MSQRNVEKIIGRLLTDEGFRRRFKEDASEVLQQLIDTGVELNECERRALLEINPRKADRFADTLHPCIQRVDIKGGKC